MDRWLHTTMDSWNGLIAATRSEQAFRQEPWHLLFEVPLACDCAGHLEAVRADRCNLFRALSSCSILRLINSRSCHFRAPPRGLAGSKTRDLPAGRCRTSSCHGDLAGCDRRTPRDSSNRLARLVQTGSGEESHICHAASGFSSGVGVIAISTARSASMTIEVVGA